nr:mediator of RNA polymerase II transcription subunit 15A [Tanacetum cinerariifolium]
MPADVSFSSEFRMKLWGLTWAPQNLTFSYGKKEYMTDAVLSSPQQQDSPPQTSQRTSMRPQLCFDTIHPPMRSGNQDGAYPPSRQLSSQTMGSVSSVANSLMDMQGVNKSI